MAKLSIMRQFIRFLLVRKRYWVIPVVILLFLIGLFVVLAETGVLAPFIYALF